LLRPAYGRLRRWRASRRLAGMQPPAHGRCATTPRHARRTKFRPAARGLCREAKRADASARRVRGTKVKPLCDAHQPLARGQRPRTMPAVRRGQAPPAVEVRTRRARDVSMPARTPERSDG
jgi:hypothetical protein